MTDGLRRQWHDRLRTWAVDPILDKPVALAIRSHFNIREGGKTVGSGVITEVVE